MNEALKTLEALLSQSAAGPQPFPPNSRYHGIGLAVHLRPDGRPVVYLKRRLVPDPERFVTLSEHMVREGERLDHLAAHYFGDPELFWRLADANGALRPEELIEEIGRRLRITLPEGISGAGNA